MGSTRVISMVARSNVLLRSIRLAWMAWLAQHLLGTGCFFFRRAFFGGPSPSSYVQPEIPTLRPGHITSKAIDDQEILNSAHHVATCNYENQSNWGFKVNFHFGVNYHEHSICKMFLLYRVFENADGLSLWVVGGRLLHSLPATLRRLGVPFFVILSDLHF